MLRNYLKTAWRNLSKNKFYSVINITGLTAGLSAGLLILLWVQNELTFDNFHSRAKNIYQVNSQIGSGSNGRIWNTTQAPVATYALKEVPGIKNAVRITPKQAIVVTYKNILLKEDNTAYTDPSFFRMFDFKLLKGNIKDPFPNDQSVIITESAAKRYFGNEDPIGKSLQEDHQENYTVTGVLADFPDNSTIHYDMLFPINIIAKQYNENTFWKSLDNDWGNFGYTTFLEVQPGTSLKNIGEQLIRIQARNAPHIKVSLKDDAFSLQPLTDVHLVSADGTPTGLQTVRIFFIIAVLILVIACINYVNLSTARSMLRAKEVSIRKIIGAEKKTLFAQFVVESVLFCAISLVFALLIMLALMPFYNQVTGKHLSLQLLDADLWKLITTTITAVLLASSIYPSILLSSFEPLKALKGKLVLGVGNASFRKVLVTVQFVFSVILIIGTVVIGKQLKFIREMDPGYERAQVLSFPTGNMKTHLEAVKAELNNKPGIDGITSADGKLENNTHTTGGITWDGKDPNATFIIHPMAVDEKFLPLMKIKLIAGNNFSGSVIDSTHFMLNETAVRLMGVKDPIGKRLKLQRTEGTITAVVKDFNFLSLKEKIEPMVIHFESASRFMYVKTSGKNASKAIAACNRAWNKYNQGFPFEFSFLDEAYGKLYASDQRTGTLFTAFSIIAIMISCLGLLGLATYTAQVKTKEIGIRKVLGATVPNILALLSKEFLALVAVAIIIASPLAWLAMNKWLENFAYRIDLGVGIFISAGVIAICIALFTISFQSVKAAIANPVKSLRSE